MKSTVALVRRVLPLRERHRPVYKDKPCLNYDIGLCPGSCQGLISETDYEETVRLAEMVFRGEGSELISRLRRRMESASEAEQFEQAGEIKEQMTLVRGGLLGSALHFSPSGAVAAGGWSFAEGDSTAGGQEHRNYSSNSDGEFRRDVVAVGLADGLACFQVFQVRDGRLTGRLGFTYRVEEGLSRGEVLQACLERYWGDALESSLARRQSTVQERPQEGDREEAGLPPFPLSLKGKTGEKEGIYVVDVPDEIVTADALPETGVALLTELLLEVKAAAVIDAEERSDKKELPKSKTSVKKRRVVLGDGNKEPSPSVKVVYGEGSGERHHLCVMVSKNAELEAKRLLKGGRTTEDGLSQLSRMLGLLSPPTRIEGYDVSHTGGGQAVASAVCFISGKASPKLHRRYRIKSPEVKKGHSDDYASLKEVISRRFAPPSSTTSAEPNPVPDLVLIDGGKGQLTAALEGAAVAAKAWQSFGHDTTTNSFEVEGAKFTAARGLPVETVGIAGRSLLSETGKAPAPLPSYLHSSFSRRDEVAQEEDPDAILLAARTPSNGSMNGQAGEGGGADVSVDVGGGRRVAFVSLAKKDEEVFVPWTKEPLAAAVEAGPSSPGVMILRQVKPGRADEKGVWGNER